MRFNRKAIKEMTVCSCPPSHAHLESGCFGVYTLFKWNGDGYDIRTVACRCKGREKEAKA